ncbi:hypothetical protein I5E68_13325 [Novosphingobium sp. YJ-S2-02]|uniref:Ubiquinol-cytochrome c chaperone domain-containing protein n=1 Tax=Novosphingobium aureum TaxID=2792964 RepID=A0A931HEJ6_9SPHN|nr:ubiquinol-cytochrome C chaperone family protein [Novosphingobium aureum]MBH0113924.1 hypothetical protein [Novosphingobium aureum]
MSLISRLFGRGTDSREAVRPLWHRTVEISREKAWYAQCGIADDVPGRFDAITLVLALVILRLERNADKSHIGATARLTELFVEDMDGQLRESGVGDLVVGKRMGKLVSSLGGRIGALREALDTDDDAALDAALARNVTMAETAGGDEAANLRASVRALHAQFAALGDEDILSARIPR